jgi:hypothetical protein
MHQTEALHNSGLRVEFNPNNKKETEEAKKRFRQAKGEYRKILSVAREPITHFSETLKEGGFIVDETEVGENQLAMHLIDKTGDQRIIWDMTAQHEVKEAAKKFEEFAAKGWKAYAIDRKGKRGMRIFSFDAEREEVIFDDRTTKEKLKDFVSKFREIKMQPRTYPG